MGREVKGLEIIGLVKREVMGWDGEERRREGMRREGWEEIGGEVW